LDCALVDRQSFSTELLLMHAMHWSDDGGGGGGGGTKANSVQGRQRHIKISCVKSSSTRTTESRRCERSADAREDGTGIGIETGLHTQTHTHQVTNGNFGITPSPLAHVPSLAWDVNIPES